MFTIDHADIVVNHMCNMNCKYCVDTFRGSTEEIIKIDYVKSFLDLLKKNTEIYQPLYMDKKEALEILILGGEPTLIGTERLVEIADEVHKHGFQIVISTNARLKNVVKEIIPYFDWIQVAVYGDAEIDYWREISTDKINVKLSGDALFNLERLNHFVEYAADFKRKSVSMFFKPNFEQCCPDKDVWDLINKLDWERVNSYEYTMYNGVRLKRCIPGVTNIEDEPLIPKLYPNGCYNKTWKNELHDPYLGELI